MLFRSVSQSRYLFVGTAISTAAFPRLNERLSTGRTDLFRKDVLRVLRAMIWITVPIVIIGFFARGYLARLIYTNGNMQISIIFGFLCAAIFFRIIYALMSRWFYAQKDTKTPLYVSLFTIGLNIILAYTLARPSAYGVAGLALAQSIVSGIEIAILSIIMLIRDPKLFDKNFLSGVFRIISVSGFTALAGFIILSFLPLQLKDTGILVLGTKLLIISAVIISVHVAISALFGLEETKPVFRRIKKVILKPIKIYPR